MEGEAYISKINVGKGAETKSLIYQFRAPFWYRYTPQDFMWKG